MKKKKIIIALGVVLLLSSIFAFATNKFGNTVNIYHANPIKITVKKKVSLPTREFTLVSGNGQKLPFIVNVLDEKNYVVVPLQKEASSVLYINNPSNVTAISEYTGEIFVQTKTNLYRLKEMNQSLYSGFGARSSNIAVEYEVADGLSSADYSTKSTSDSESKTNVQVKGVDEADIVKVLGNNIFYAQNNNIHIATVNNGKIVGQSLLKLDDNFYLYEMYVDKTRLVAIGSTSKNHKQFTQAIVYDISNLNAPKKYRTLSQEGYHVSSRKINNDIYLITENWLGSGFNVPMYMDSVVSNNYRELDLKELRFFPPYNPNSLVAISNFSVMNKDASKVTSFIGSANNIYMNKENLFVSYVDYYSEPLPIQPVPYIEENSSTDDEEIISVTPDDYYAPKTIIKKFSIKNKKFTYIGEAKIVGTLINQFAMDESNGYFRVAYTKNYEQGSEVAVFDKNMKQVGILKAIAPTERIYSARFMGNRLYLVTFKETDPFFVIDLKNPKKPTVLGYLKIPGFSNYLHPYDDTHIIGFGNATQETNYNTTITNGMKIAMFDVSDVKNPVQISNVEIGSYGTYSELMYNHKALMYNAEKKYFGFPINVTERRKDSKDIWDVQTVFLGGFVYEVTNDFKLNFKGKTTHIENISNYSTYDYDRSGEIRRLVYIGDYIYSISDKQISSNKASDMSFVQKVEWDYRK